MKCELTHSSYSPEQKFPVTHIFFCFLLYVRINETVTNVEQNKTYHMYFEIINQITHKMGVFHYA